MSNMTEEIRQMSEDVRSKKSEIRWRLKREGLPALMLVLNHPLFQDQLVFDVLCYCHGVGSGKATQISNDADVNLWTKVGSLSPGRKDRLYGVANHRPGRIPTCFPEWRDD